jgi:hypothetical protein
MPRLSIFGLPSEFACRHCRRDFRVAANHLRRPCFQSSLEHHRYLLEHSERGVPQRVVDGCLDREGGLAAYARASRLFERFHNETYRSRTAIALCSR